MTPDLHKLKIYCYQFRDYSQFRNNIYGKELPGKFEYLNDSSRVVLRLGELVYKIDKPTVSPVTSRLKHQNYNEWLTFHRLRRNDLLPLFRYELDSSWFQDNETISILTQPVVSIIDNQFNFSNYMEKHPDFSRSKLEDKLRRTLVGSQRFAYHEVFNNRHWGTYKNKLVCVDYG